MNNGLTIGGAQLRAACAAWQSGGTMGLALWLSKHTPHFGVADYAELVGLVRAELGDDTDYGTDTPR
jgi:hypothetical protein